MPTKISFAGCLFYFILFFNLNAYAQPNYDASDCGTCKAENIKVLDDAINLSDGVIGVNPEAHNIGRYGAIKHGIPFMGKNWYPLRPTKQILCGTLSKFEIYDGAGDEMDWNIYILPDAGYEGLILDAVPYKFTHTLNTLHLDFGQMNDEWHSIKVNGKKRILVEAEVTPDEHFYNNPWFPKDGRSPLINRKICVYGPHIREEAHGSRPEIHPCEQIWWRDQDDSYYLMLLLDDSNRFDDPQDFGFGKMNLGGVDVDIPLPRNWRPWATEDGLTGSFKIAFQFDATTEFRSFQISILDSHEFNTRQVNQDIDDGIEHSIIYNGKKVLSITEPPVSDNNIGIRFESVCYNTQKNKLQGFIVITTSVGNGEGKEGYVALRIDRAKASQGTTIVKEWQYNSGHSTWKNLRVDAERTSVQEMVFSDYKGTGIIDGILDFDGNGKSDVFKKMNNMWYVSYDGTSEWTMINQAGTRLRDLRFGDFDGDKKTDVFTSDAIGDWKISYGGTTKWRKVNHSIHGIRKLRVGDFDGDNRTDIFGSDLSEYKFKVQYGADAGSWKDLVRPMFRGNFQPNYRGNMIPFSIDEMRFGDFDGDNKTDVLILYYDGINFSRKDTWWVSWGGDSNWEKLRKDDKRVPFTQLIFGNFDAGSKSTDILYFDKSNWYYSFNAKTEWSRVKSSDGDLLTIAFGDFNGDNVSDAFKTKKSTVKNDVVFEKRILPSKNVVTKNTYVKNSLKRTNVDGKNTLTMNVDLRAIDPSETNSNPIARVRFLRNNQKLKAAPIYTSTATDNNIKTELKSVNVLADKPSTYEIETTTGQRINTEIPVFSITTAITELKPVAASRASDLLWNVLRNSTGNNSLKPPENTQAVKTIQLTVTPFYAAVKDGSVSIEEGSPLTEEINGAISKSDKQKMKDLFGQDQPFMFDWTFEAYELNSGNRVPIVINKNADANQISVDLKNGNFDKNILNIKFPSLDKIYLVHASVTVKDTYGKTGTKSYPIWSYYSPISKEQLKIFIDGNPSPNKDFEVDASTLADDGNYTVSELILLLQSHSKK